MGTDYIVVGAGSAGCAIAARLSEDPDVSVLLLEAGGWDISPFIHIPGGLKHLVGNPRVNWDYQTEPEPELMDRSLYWPRGRVMGGSSSVNAMVYIRGQREDYDRWGCEGWSWDDVLPYFLRAEDNQAGVSEWHGVGGPLRIEHARYRNPTSEAFVEAAASAGHEINDDFNGATQRGCGYYQSTQRFGRRCSSSVAYAHPNRGRPNLTIITRALVHRVLIDGGRASGVEYSRSGELTRANADREVILCGGAVNSPQLLMLSGIGPAEHLGEVGIPCVADRPEVGENLHDHLDICTLVRSRRPVTLDLRWWEEAWAFWVYLLSRKGPAATGLAEAGGFACSSQARDGRPDIQFHFVPALLDDHGRNPLGGHGYTLHACFLQPESRGRIWLRSADPTDAPRIAPRYLSASGDLAPMIDAVTLSREIFAQGPFDRFRAEEIYPGETVDGREGIEGFVRRRAETVYHPVGSCRMGDDETSVVDTELRVRGVDGLRVADASIIPRIISGNTNAPVVMIAERAADLIRGRPEGR